MKKEIIGMANGSKYDQPFKESAVRYRLDHPELPLEKATENLRIRVSALNTWIQAARGHEGNVSTHVAGRCGHFLGAYGKKSVNRVLL